MLENLDWPKIVKHLSSFATSAEGKDRLLDTKPLLSQDQAVENFEVIKEAQQILSLGERPFMEGLDLFPSWFRRLEKQSQLKPLGLKDIRLFFMETLALKKVLQSSDKPWALSTLKTLMDAKPPLAAIDQLITPQADIRTDASDILFKLYNDKKQHAQKIHSTLNGIVKANDNDSILQDKFVTNREGRWVIPIKSGMQHEISGIIHATSNTKQTVFMEPQEIVPLNNQLKKIEAAIEEEIDNLLKQISQYLFTLTTDIESTKHILLNCDIRFAQGQFSHTINAHPVHFSTDNVDLIEAKHPLMVINNEDIIPNSIQLNKEDRILLLSGPNAGGKTVLLKCFGLSAQMARCGLPVCASPESKIPFFKDIIAAVGDSQSVDSQLSTFVGHLNALNNACAVSGPQTLILIDEICGSTDPEEGSALARGFINYYSKNKSYSLITSHLGPLKSGWTNESGVINGSMEYNRETGTSTYHFIKGIPGQSLAFSTAKRVGVLDDVYKYAQDYLSPETRVRFETMDDVEKIKDQVAQLREELKLRSQELEAEKQTLRHKIREFEKERETRLKDELKSIKDQIVEEAQKGNVQKVFADHERRSSIQLDFPEVVKSPSKSEAQDVTLEKFTKAFPPGSVVYVLSLKRDAIIQGAPNKQGDVPILAGSMRLMIPWSELKPPKKATNPLMKRSFQSDVVAEIADRGTNIDLRGKNVQDAIEDLELFLDSAVGKRHERVKIVHGHGSEAIKKAVRSHLSRSVYVNRWTAGQESSGGDGTTLAYLSLD